MNFQLPTKDEKAAYVLKQFDRIAKKYDFANDLISLGMHRLWKQQAIAELLAANPERKADGLKYLDVCTGTGDLALLLASKLGPRGEVVGLDFSPEMLDVARQRSARASNDKLAPLSWIQGDAQNLPLADNTFDGAIISFGLRNLTDLQKGLNELARVVKPGGRVINLDLGQPDLPVFTPFFLFFFDNIVPLIGEIVQQDRQAYTYLPESRKSYPHPDRLSEMFVAAGMTDVRWHKLALGSVAMHIGTVK